MDALVAHMRDGRIADGFVATIDIRAGEFAAQFPRTATAEDELPNRIYLI